MKKDNNKKTKETNIGKIIYGFLLFMPLIAIGVTCFYAIFNKNAYQSYSEKTVNQNVNISNYQDVALGTKYNLLSKEFNDNNNQFASRFSYISLTAQDLNVQQSEYENLDFIIVNTGGYIRFSNHNAPTSWVSSIPFEENIEFQIVFSQFDNGIANINQWFYVNQIVLTTSKLDNVFYYSVDKVEQSNLFNWAKNSIVYTTLLATCNALSITNTFIPMLLAYWLIISVIYILYDIALVMLLIFHNKVHCLQDSI